MSVVGWLAGAVAIAGSVGLVISSLYDLARKRPDTHNLRR